MPILNVPVVGMHFRPPAKPLMSVLPQGCPLVLEREPQNEYDPQAVRVLVLTKDIPEGLHAKLGERVEAYGFDLEAILAQESWHLGYVKKEYAQTLSPQLEAFEAKAELAFDAKGFPSAVITLTEKE